MREIIYVEWRRVLPFWTWLLLTAAILVYAVYDNEMEKNRYDYVDHNGELIDGGEILKDAMQDKKAYLIEDMLHQGAEGSLLEGSFTFVKAQDFATKNYGRQMEELTSLEIAEFGQKRLAHIRQTLEESSTVSYSRQEIASLVAKAGLEYPIMVGYAVGWISLNCGMDQFVPLLLFGISILLIPLFGEDSKTRMGEFILSAKRGRMPLAYARILTAFGTGSVLYLYGVAEYAFIKLSAFGVDGGDLLIQSDETMLFSVYPVSYIQQFFQNCGMGYWALLVAISFTLLICIIVKKALASSAVLCFCWIFLLIGEQMSIYITNHCFFNFMPYRMARFGHYYLENDLYRIGGLSISSMIWTACVAAMITMAVLGIDILFLKMQHKESGDRLDFGI